MTHLINEADRIANSSKADQDRAAAMVSRSCATPGECLWLARMMAAAALTATTDSATERQIARAGLIDCVTAARVLTDTDRGRVCYALIVALAGAVDQVTAR